MSEHATDQNAYVYQPNRPRKDGRFYGVGGINFTGLTKDEAEAIVEAINEISWLGDECPYCGHVARFASTACPQCSKAMPAPWRTVKRGARCRCERCKAAS